LLWQDPVPAGSSDYDVAVYHANISTNADVVLGCARPWAYRSNSASIRVRTGMSVAWQNVWAGHELMHGVFFFGDHIRMSTPNPQYYTNPKYCDDPSYYDLYIGGLSYCWGAGYLFYYDYPNSSIIDDYDMLRGWYP